MEDRRDTGAGQQAQVSSWLTREGALVGMVLWAVGITTLAWLPETGLFLPRHPSMFVGLKGVAAWLWLLVGAQGLQRWAQRHPRAPPSRCPRRHGGGAVVGPPLANGRK